MDIILKILKEIMQILYRIANSLTYPKNFHSLWCFTHQIVKLITQVVIFFMKHSIQQFQRRYLHYTTNCYRWFPTSPYLNFELLSLR